MNKGSGLDNGKTVCIFSSCFKIMMQSVNGAKSLMRKGCKKRLGQLI